MHKKLSGDLTSLAHSVLQMKNKEDVFALKQKAYEIYEKLSVLAYVEEYIKTTPNSEYTKEELLEKVEKASEVILDEVKEHNESEVLEIVHEEVVLATEKIVEEVAEAEETIDKIIEEVEENEEVLEEEITLKHETEESTENGKIEEEIADMFQANEKPAEEKIAHENNSLEQELEDTIAVDVVADLFESAPKKSLNDQIQGDLQIGLNDRIAFVKQLFDGSQEDFNRVVSQLNTLKTEKEAKKFINKMVKPDYDWTDKEEFEERFMAIVERKFA